MSFSDTYRHEIYLSRKDRGRRALFWAKVIGIVLALTVGATLRAEPDLRSALMTAGMNGVAHVANLTNPQANRDTRNAVSLSQADQQNLPTSQVRVNRLVSTGHSEASTPSDDLERNLATTRPEG